MSLDEATVLELGARGKLRGAAFALAGRTLLRSKSGGVWNEWTVRFDDGRIATLAEARGTFTLYVEGAIAAPWDTLRAGAPLATGFVVAERGEATRSKRWGETEAAPKTYRYADLSSGDGRSATIDYGEKEPRVFVGTRCTLAELGLRPRKEPARFVPVAASKPPKGLDLVLAVGDEGTLGKTRFRVLGALHRSIRVEGERYTWEEYLLFEPEAGFRWLVCSDGHWNLVESLEPGTVTLEEKGASFEGVLHKPWSEGTARVEWATGEFPWEVAIGDEVRARDFVRAPHVLSLEATGDEIAWSRGTYLSPDAVSKAFGKRVLPKPVGRAPNQPRPEKRT